VATFVGAPPADRHVDQLRGESGAVAALGQGGVA
jgi:hypothetical protein